VVALVGPHTSGQHHFDDALRHRRRAQQLEVFSHTTANLPGERSLCNSAATLRFAGDTDSVRADWVRPGIMVYGSSPDFPDHSAPDWDLWPTMSLRSEIIAVQELQPGDRVGYGASFTAQQPMRIGVVACGYADGYPRVVPNCTPLLVDGQRCPMAGRVSMDMITVDLTTVPQAGVGTPVTLWGQDASGARLSIDEIAHAAGTVGYELMCALAQRVPTRVEPLKQS